MYLSLAFASIFSIALVLLSFFKEHMVTLTISLMPFVWSYAGMAYYGWSGASKMADKEFMKQG